MKYHAQSGDYCTVYLKWPQNLPKECPVCQEKVIKKYADNGKIVHSLAGDINQITIYYHCINPNCKMHDIVFNPQSRFEFEGFYYGKDVVQKVAFYALKKHFKAAYILDVLQTEYKLKISESTIRRMINVVTVVKSEAIDQKTLEIIKKQKVILMGLDGEDPLVEGPGLWLFVDLISNRLLSTVYLESATADILHDEIEKIISLYSVKISGFISDKQNNITSCISKYYPKIPHQYCGYHFMNNIWNHLELLDGKLHKRLSQVIQNSYFLNTGPNSPIYIEEHGKIAPKTVFSPIIADLKKMKRFRNKKFEQLRGIKFFEHLDDYTAQMFEIMSQVPQNYRIHKIYRREGEKWTESLSSLYSLYSDCNELFEIFKEIYSGYFAKNVSSSEIEDNMATLFVNLEQKLLETDQNFVKTNLRAYLPRSSSTYLEIMGEWLRLWESYRNGLFSYRKFEKPILTNNTLEQAFGRQKSHFYSRSAKKQVGRLILTEGDYHLRFVFCRDEELESDIWEEASNLNWRLLKSMHDGRKKVLSENWLKKTLKFLGISKVQAQFYEKRLT
ncbi:hypothetical protein DSAG12_04330 [Promethearchaeum syntrophicum]|uniref:MULE transposase domain protein n=2 Tax=Promethearchaeum syntrophicum TaxID=2594042 RepID=A0A5B9D5I4_9ARCH|nr:hypothetical protein [Candidatus Prometheoarchaeum syntrophicum]QEE14369.1 hypothetical protein DSAG12_00182 [Candidatus Prometheoarchaeum syntrophicum]QEE16909.1 hypothetical protein DSAG12_02739 [Candidatus Prometheoarchaeum syntrophicum]